MHPYRGPYKVAVWDCETKQAADNSQVDTLLFFPSQYQPFHIAFFGTRLTPLSPALPRLQSGILVRLYYPTQVSTRRASWLPRGPLYSIGYGNFLKLPTIISLLLLHPALAWIKTRGQLNASLHPAGATSPPPAPALPTRLPVIIFSHGLGGTRTTYSTYCGDLASRGMVVVALEHRDGSAAVAARNGYADSIKYRYPQAKDKPEGQPEDEYLMNYRREQLGIRVREVGEAVELVRALGAGVEVENLMGRFGGRFDPRSFAGRFDLDRLVMAGHSFGAATALSSIQDPKTPFKCCLAHDPWMYAVDDRLVLCPVLSIQSEVPKQHHPHSPRSSNNPHYDS
ncbi:platelet-activating factor acetylhydrolase, isoform II-domain-containing protein [Blyttiomyces helicus]|uniref:1-alkyl-2-acetylglycerophosphocholine esterase n=1 Tax=Blyttiomyces helicus TaxID=388810 RepID=A0A4P9WGC7_9FUNG|nr:platelet-activating factor acetylhydrolase, isoform II-domain-containing protein [Blyttiomyces helicus]|eukprot:RKO91392.1 platelet-activating factor acetylhydrolase, isoform II-domain-containing protein [Blyttiomyces helicus]